MFRSGKWRNEKNRIKVVFRLKFHATQASQFNTEGLTLSLVPGDVGKPTARSEKAVVSNGQCRWEIPVYETVKFLKDAKTGKVNQRIYHLIVSTTGSTRGGLVGETSIDFADYADAIKTCNVCLPLQSSNAKALLHVSFFSPASYSLGHQNDRSPSPDPVPKQNIGASTTFLRSLLLEMKISIPRATIVYCDNVSAIYLSTNPVQHQRTKHVEIDIHFVREKVAIGEVKVLHVPSSQQFADIFTKGLPSPLFLDFKNSLSIRCTNAKTAGSVRI